MTTAPRTAAAIPEYIRIVLRSIDVEGPGGGGGGGGLGGGGGGGFGGGDGLGDGGGGGGGPAGGLEISAATEKTLRMASNVATFIISLVSANRRPLPPVSINIASCKSRNVVPSF